MKHNFHLDPYDIIRSIILWTLLIFLITKVHATEPINYSVPSQITIMMDDVTVTYNRPTKESEWIDLINDMNEYLQLFITKSNEEATYNNDSNIIVIDLINSLSLSLTNTRVKIDDVTKQISTLKTNIEKIPDTVASKSETIGLLLGVQYCEPINDDSLPLGINLGVLFNFQKLFITGEVGTSLSRSSSPYGIINLGLWIK